MRKRAPRVAFPGRQRGFLLNPFRFGGGGGGGPFVCDAADFDGTNDYLSRAGLTGIADSKSGIFSCWVNLDAETGNKNLLTICTMPGASVSFRVVLGDSVGAGRVIVVEGNQGLLLISEAFDGVGGWVHVLTSWDVATGAIHLYLSDVESMDLASGSTAGANANIDYTRSNTYAVSNDTPNDPQIDGGIAEFYFAAGQYLDFSVEANRRKFIDATGKPVDLGADGSAPTGSQPTIYLHLDNGEAAANFAVNAGSGGNFTVVGALTTFPNSPSD